MDVTNGADARVSGIAAAIGEPARARILFCLMDGRARSSTELAAVAEVSPSTTSAHLSRLMAEGLVKVTGKGKHRYYNLQGPEVARVLEGLSVLAGGAGKRFEPTTSEEFAGRAELLRPYGWRSGRGATRPAAGDGLAAGFGGRRRV